MRYLPHALLLCLLLTTPAHAQSEDYLNDRAIKAHIEAVGTELMEAGETVEFETLLQQLAERSTYDAAPPAPGELTEDGEGIYDTADDGVLIIAGLYLCDRCDNLHANCASGFVISEDGLAVTNYHVMENESLLTMVAMTRDGAVVPVVEVLAANEADDTALIRLGGEGFTPLPIARDAEVGERVHAITHPNQQFYYYSSGEIARFFVIPTGGRGQNAVRRVGITADYARGSSGGPVLNDRGQVVAMVAATRSLEAEPDAGGDANHQMTLHDCVPYESILDLFEQADAE